MSDYLRTYLLEQIAAWALVRAVAAEDAAARLAADRAVLIAQRDALARKLAEASPALPPSVLPIRLEEPAYRHAVRVTLPGFVDRVELAVRVLP